MYSRFRYAVPVAVMSIIALCFLAGCEECPEGVPKPPAEGSAAIEGLVRDAISGIGVEVAHLQVGDAETDTDTAGYFFLEDVVPGTVTLSITADGYIDFETELELADAETLWQEFTIVPLSEVDEWRIILTWGLNPDDLDSHLWVPTGVETYMPVDWVNDGYLDQPPYAQLDIDDTESYGPETITIRKHTLPSVLTMDYYAGEYVYAVHHWSGDSDIPNSGAQVRIYSGNTLVRTINAPAGEAYEDWYWYVGRLNCRTGAWTLVNEYNDYSPLPWDMRAQK
jgi:hypothetical protein